MSKNDNKMNRELLQERASFLARDYSRGFVRHCGIEAVEVSFGKFTSRLKIGEHHRQQDGFIHAGVMATMADHTAGYAGFTVVDEEHQILTIEFKINFLRPALGNYLVCKSRVIRRGSSVIIAESEVTDVRAPDEEDKLVAKALVTLMPVHKSRLEDSSTPM